MQVTVTSILLTITQAHVLDLWYLHPCDTLYLKCHLFPACRSYSSFNTEAEMPPLLRSLPVSDPLFSQQQHTACEEPPPTHLCLSRVLYRIPALKVWLLINVELKKQMMAHVDITCLINKCEYFKFK